MEDRGAPPSISESAHGAKRGVFLGWVVLKIYSDSPFYSEQLETSPCVPKKAVLVTLKPIGGYKAIKGALKRLNAKQCTYDIGEIGVIILTFPSTPKFQKPSHT